MIFMRDQSDKNTSNFLNLLGDCDWANITELSNPNDAYNCFIDRFTDCYTASFPLKKVNRAKFVRKNSKGLLTFVKHKNTLYKKFVRKPTSATEKMYKKYKNKLTRLLRITKHIYYEMQLQSVKSDINSLSCRLLQHWHSPSCKENGEF
jgi:hypothetical protein